MNDTMTPIPLRKLMSWILGENKKGVVFDIKRSFIMDPDKTYETFGRKPETSFGSVADPYTQLTQNIVVSYVADSRFFELKTIQKLDGEDLPIFEPCTKTDDEYYNCEWSIELYVSQAFDEHVRAWFVCRMLAREHDLGSPDDFQLNMPVGCDLDGVKTEKIDRFVEDMKDASETVVFKECRQWLLGSLDRFGEVSKEDMEVISPSVCNCVTLSTLHGCPPREIERIVRYLTEEKKVHTFIKRNPTLPDYEYVGEIMGDMGYDYVAFGDSHFEDDLQYRDTAPMLQRLQALVDEKGLEFGAKITNTFPIDVEQNELPSEEIYMPGKSLYPLSMSIVKMLVEDFGGKLRVSYSGGADFFNIADIVDVSIWPVTTATTILKPGSYERLEQIGQLFAAREATAFEGADAAKTIGLVEAAKSDRYYTKTVRPLPSRKVNRPVPLTDCFIVPCQGGCPIRQNITRYLRLAGANGFGQALKVILNKDPPPSITDTIYTCNCMSECTRNFYESPVDIRRTKLEVAEGGFRAVMVKLKAPEIISDKKAAVVGGGPIGLAAAYLLVRGGVKMTLLEKKEKTGDVARNVIPGFYISDSAIDNDVKLMAAVGVEMVNSREITDIEELKKDYDHVVLTIDASEQGILKLETGDTTDALDLLARFKAAGGEVELGRNMAVIDDGNTAMNTAGAAKRNAGVEKVSLIYKRTRRCMPVGEEELAMAVGDSVEFAEFLVPVKLEGGTLYCERMILGDIDASGHHSVVEADQVVEVPTDTVIAAIGEEVPGAFYGNYGIVLDSGRCPQTSQEMLETSMEDVYVAGDGLYGPVTVAEGIRGGKMVAETIIEKALVRDLFKLSDAEAIYERKGRLAEENAHVTDSTHCLFCNSYCENYVEVCPNRANILLVIPDMEEHQIIHVDYMRNEYGNCKSFCPRDSAPYPDRFTLFASEADMTDSKNQDFMVLGATASVCRIGLQDKAMDYTAGFANADMSDDIRKIIQTVTNGYSYMLQIASELL